MTEISVAPETLFSIGPFDVTNSLIGTWLAMLFLIALAFVVRRNLSMVPGRLQSLIEWPIEGMLNLVTGVDHQRGLQYFPLVISMFLFILTMNWMGLLPGFGTIGLLQDHEGHQVLVPLLRAGTADLSATLALSLVSFFVFIGFGVAVHGPAGYVKTFANPPALAPLEILQQLFRAVSLSLRLFGNIFAGEAIQIVFLSFLGPAAFVIPAVFILLELLFGLVQAGIFALLTMTYILLATLEHGPSHGPSDETGTNAGDHAGGVTSPAAS
ncbi:MAG TPA: F0F1 ATP synthase subunit A [Candidatus Limnocylindrales bacterium]|nr:F0F1 ATP synthase subunit A [Candidatus Limnocylindrales bacterium]